MEAIRYSIQYRCKRCMSVYTFSKLTLDQANSCLHSYVLGRDLLIHQPEVQRYHIHCCQDHASGISEFVGFEDSELVDNTPLDIPVSEDIQKVLRALFTALPWSMVKPVLVSFYRSALQDDPPL